MSKKLSDKVELIAGESTWIAGESIRQLMSTSELPGMIKAIGLPDIQPGKGSPSGASFLSSNVHPTLVGTDIGCGMGFWITDMPAYKFKIDKVVKSLNGLDSAWDGNVNEWLATGQVGETPYDHTLGTPGRGNHFIELQRVDSIENETLFQNLKLDDSKIHMLIHSGSRGFGESILLDVIKEHGDSPLNGEEAERYIKRHDHAVKWAHSNRALCHHRVCDALNIETRSILDISHNAVSPFEYGGCSCWLHRKGAAPTDKGPIIIPGSRGDLSALVVPMVNSDLLNSVAHGAGRKMARYQAKGKLDHNHTKDQLKRNKWGGQLICGEDLLVWEEAPECYKTVTSVIEDLKNEGLIEVVAYLRPLVTFKTSEGVRQERDDHKKEWKNSRREARKDKHGKNLRSDD